MLLDDLYRTKVHSHHVVKLRALHKQQLPAAARLAQHAARRQPPPAPGNCCSCRLHCSLLLLLLRSVVVHAGNLLDSVVQVLQDLLVLSRKLLVPVLRKQQMKQQAVSWSMS